MKSKAPTQQRQAGRQRVLGIALAVAAALALAPSLARADDKDEPTSHFKDADAVSDGSVTVGSTKIDYQAIAGVLVVHPKGWDDVKPLPSDRKGDDGTGPEATMSYVAYLQKNAGPGRPITFLYNGGPGSSSVWLHMGAFGPRRVLTPDDSHGPGAPYQLVNNGQSLLDASDLVFVDAPGTGFGRLAGHDAQKSFWGIDQDAEAFSDFITRFLSINGRWNSPKYLFGESYGTTRSAVLAYMLENERDLDLNGVILLSQVLNFDLGPDAPAVNPGIFLPYVLELPTFAATAWYHHRLSSDHPDLAALLTEVEQFATTDYAQALEAGSTLDDATRDRIVAKLHEYTSLPPDYIRRADLRIDGGEFEQNLLGPGETTGRLDTRFAGPTMDPLAKEALYDPQSAAISSAYVSTFNDYVRRVLHYGAGQTYRAEIDLSDSAWDQSHQQPQTGAKLTQTPNVMPDLAAALEYDPALHVQLNAGYFDLATPFYEGIYEMHHLPMPQKLQANIEYHQYQSGHMVYAHQESLQKLHDNVADFIRRTDNAGHG